MTPPLATAAGSYLPQQLPGYKERRRYYGIPRLGRTSHTACKCGVHATREGSVRSGRHWSQKRAQSAPSRRLPPTTRLDARASAKAQAASHTTALRPDGRRFIRFTLTVHDLYMPPPRDAQCRVSHTVSLCVCVYPALYPGLRAAGVVIKPRCGAHTPGGSM